MTALLLALPWQPSLAVAQAQQGAVPEIKVTVKEGEGALNNIRTLRAKEPVVQVTDATDRPIAGAQVTFLVPELGASGMFGTSGSTLTVSTAADGLATGRGLKPNNVVGQFQIRVVASYQGQTARAIINQTNAASQKSSSNAGKTAIILALVGGAGAAVAVGVTRGGNKTSASPTPAGTSISAGGSTFGPPR
ncbi:MAG TPA: hypothetical protein VM120_21470 [Bryobacteraceae bacterium]|nr:hypothetical protein [Bryobacteraceae bacterium]